jgi:hypothetical protein
VELGAGAQKFNYFENFFSVKKPCFGFMVDYLAAVQLGTSAMEIVNLILLSALFAAGVACGYYLRDRKSRKRRERHLRAKRYVNIPESNVERASSLRNKALQASAISRTSDRPSPEGDGMGLEPNSNAIATPVVWPPLRQSR